MEGCSERDGRARTNDADFAVRHLYEGREYTAQTDAIPIDSLQPEQQPRTPCVSLTVSISTWECVCAILPRPVVLHTGKTKDT